MIRFDWNFYRQQITNSLPLQVAIAGLLITATMAIYIYASGREKEQLQFQNEVEHVQRAVTETMDVYLALLRATRGYIYTHEDITYESFSDFVAELQLRQVYPGVQGIGYIEVVDPLRKQQLEQTLHSQGWSDFSIHPLQNERAYYPILYLEPPDQLNQTALGFDMYSQEVRRAAMELARDSGEAVLSGKTTLLQQPDSAMQTGFLFVLPIYAGNDTPDTVEERRQRIRGYVYLPFRPEDFFSEVYKKNGSPRVNIIVYDGETEDAGALLYTSSENGTHKSRFRARGVIYNASRPWTVVYQSTAVSEAVNDTLPDRRLLPFLIALGLATTTLLFFISRTLVLARLKAERIQLELMQSQIALQSGEELTRMVMDSLPALIAVLDGKGTIVSTNSSWSNFMATFYGSETTHPFSVGDNIKVRLKTNTSLMGETFSARGREGLEKLLRGQLQQFVLEYPVTVKNGEEKWFLLVASALKHEGGGVVVSSTDITKLKRADQQKEEFLSIASHELKTPITSARAYVQVLQKILLQHKNKKVAPVLSKVLNQIEKMQLLISDLLDVSKIEAGKLRLNKQVFVLAELVSEVAEAMQLASETHTVRLRNESTAQVNADRERIGQVITNLIDNAIKYSPEADVVEVVCIDDGTHVQMSVTDFGLGIPKKDQKYLFKRFYRVRQMSQGGVYPGLGLGLYICNEIMQRSGGTLLVQSKSEVGSTFTFRLPILKET